MRLPGILTALAIAAAPAYAEPVPVPTDDGIYDRHSDRHDSRRDGWYDRDDRNDRNVYDAGRYVRFEASRDFRGRWVPLMRRTDADNGRQFIEVAGRGGRLDKLRIESDRGTPLIKRVAIEYRNGTREVLRVDATLSRGHGQVIDLQGKKRVSRIVVITDPRFDGVYSVYGT